MADFKTWRRGKTSKIRRRDPYKENWASLANSIKARDGFCCQRCGATENLEVHHIIPVSKGGRNLGINLITLCHACHAKQPKHGHLSTKKNKTTAHQD